MSALRQIPPRHSPSPATSAVPQPISAQSSSHPRSLLPSPHLGEPLLSSASQQRAVQYATQHDQQQCERRDSAVSEEAVGSSLEPSRAYVQDAQSLNFHPFFTLVSDTVTSEHHHPTVHYIFADDDADIVTEAALRSLSENELRDNHSPRSREDHSDDDSPKLPLPPAGITEHYLILDVQPQPLLQREHSPVEPTSVTTGDPTAVPKEIHPTQPTYNITSAHSLSPEWQITTTSVTAAPTLSTTAATNKTDSAEPSPQSPENLMLLIEGRSNTPPGADDRTRTHRQRITTQKVDEGDGKESLEDMIDRFQRRTEEIRRMITGIGADGDGDGDYGDSMTRGSGHRQTYDGQDEQGLVSRVLDEQD